jgi:hypothetical protein
VFNPWLKNKEHIMPRGVRKQSIEGQANQQKSLCNPAIREKAKESFERRKVLRSIDSLATADLAPLDDELKQLKARVECLENAKRLILAIRGQEAPPVVRAKLLPAATEAGGEKDLAEKLVLHLRNNPAMGVGDLSDYFSVERLVLLRVLNNDKRFTSNAHGLWSLKD